MYLVFAVTFDEVKVSVFPLTIFWLSHVSKSVLSFN